MHVPGVERIPPVLPVRVECVRRRAGDLGPLEELRPGLDVGAFVGDVDRHVADQSDAARAGVLAERVPLPFEPHLIGKRGRSCEARPLAGPEGMARDEVLELEHRYRGRRDRRGGAASRRTPTSSDRASRTRPAARAGAPATRTARPRRASRRIGTPRRRAGPPGSEVGCRRIPEERGSCTRLTLADRRNSPGRATSESSGASDAHPDPAGNAADRLRPLSA